MKKVLLIVLVLLMFCFTAVGCKKQNTDNSSITEVQETQRSPSDLDKEQSTDQGNFKEPEGQMP